MTLYEIKKTDNILLFNEMLVKNGLEWLINEGSSMINKTSYVVANKEGNYFIKNPNFSIPALFMMKFDEKYKSYYFDSVLDVKENEKVKNVSRVSKEQKENVEDKYFKLLMKNDTHFALEYGYELFERDRNRFFQISVCFALMSGWEKVLYVLAMKKMLEMNFAKETQKNILVITIKFLASYVNRLDRYEEIYKNKNEIGNVVIEDIEREISNYEKSENLSYENSLELIYLKGIRLYMGNNTGKNEAVFYNLGKSLKNYKKYDFEIEKAAIKL